MGWTLLCSTGLYIQMNTQLRTPLGLGLIKDVSEIKAAVYQEHLEDGK